jgi:hypothetical protein
MRQPGDYQPEAVAAASRILNDRQIATEELQSLDQSLQDLEDAKRQKTEKYSHMCGLFFCLLCSVYLLLAF